MKQDAGMLGTRRWLCATALMGVWMIFGAQASAQNFPAKLVNVVVPYPAGGASDVMARLLSERLSQVWGQPVVVNNRPGAGGSVGGAVVARAPGDGYTLYATTAIHTISASLYKNLPFDPIKDFAPISLMAAMPLVLLTTPSLPVKTLQELISYLRAQPGAIFGSQGIGSPNHLSGELFKAQHKLTFLHVPYKGDAPLLTDLVGSHVQMGFLTVTATLPYSKSGRLNPIALAHPKRIDAIGEVPTFAEAGMPGFTAGTWLGLFGPASMSAELQNRIYQDVSKIVANPEFTRRLIEFGAVVVNSSPQAFQAYIQSESQRWAEAVRLSGAQAE